MEQHGSLRNTMKTEKLADSDILTLMMVRPHCILKKKILVVKPKTFSDVEMESRGFKDFLLQRELWS